MTLKVLFLIRQSLVKLVDLAQLYMTTVKGASHAILGNFSTVQMVIELSKISQKRLKTIEDLKQNTGKPGRVMDGQYWRG